MDQGTLIVGVITGAFGTAYFVYGRKQQRIVALCCGLAMIVAPYAIDPLWAQITVCSIFAVLPWVWQA